MRVLIYGEGEAASLRRDELRQEKHHTSLRNPEFFNPDQFERVVDLVISDDERVLEAYQNIGIDTQILTIRTDADQMGSGWGESEDGPEPYAPQIEDPHRADPELTSENDGQMPETDTDPETQPATEYQPDARAVSPADTSYTTSRTRRRGR